ncbi:hypothetical protein HOG48_02795 [Candidatus Peregrinibacteria bacterium]|nr:hypothetical protein [Candidatus Peregrinibacteria bacterium]
MGIRARAEFTRTVWAGGSGNDDGNSKWQPTLGYSEDGVEELFMDPFFDDAFNAFRTTHRERLAWLEEEFGCDVI